MRHRTDKSVLGHLHTLFNVGTIRELTDGQLLERFATGPREAAELAFAALVERHGSMVLRVCRSVLADEHDAHDAFQATFLVLAQRVSTLWVRDSLGPWLHQVSYRTACQARSAAARRRRHERRAAECAARVRPAADAELERLLHEEIERLPECFRAAIVLCDLGGRTHEQAARHLGLPVGTVKSRLARGRARLRAQLTRRGIGPDASVMGVAIGRHLPKVDVPPPLSESATRMVIQTTLSRALVSGSAAALAARMIRAMSVLHALKLALVVLLVAGLTASAPLLAQKTEHKPRAQTAATPPNKEADKTETVEAKPGHLGAVARGRGTVQWSKVVEGIAQVEGQSTIIALLPGGTTVRKGQVVCELDSATLKGQLLEQEIASLGADTDHRRATLARERAEAALNEYTEHAYKEQQALLQTELDSAQEELHDADDRVERSRRARQRLDKVLDQHNAAQTPADILASLDLDDRVDAAVAARRRAERALKEVQARKLTLEQSTRTRTTKALSARVEEARADEQARAKRSEMEKAREKTLRVGIEHCTIHAPIDGRLFLETNPAQPVGSGTTQFLAAGVTVHTGQKIFTVYGGPFIVDVKLPHSLGERITIGDPVRLELLMNGSHVVNGVIEKVDTAGVQQGFGLNRAIRRTVAIVTVRIERGTPSVGPNMPLSAAIPVRAIPNLPSVPLSAVLQNGGKDRVAVKTRDGRIDWREVSLGLDDGEIVEVARGLANGESVVPEPDALLSPQEQAERFGPIEYP